MAWLIALGTVVSAASYVTGLVWVIRKAGADKLDAVEPVSMDLSDWCRNGTYSYTKYHHRE